jgi:hypothetical protein
MGTPADWESSNPYESLAAKPYNYHLNHWWKVIIDNCGKCLLCHDAACNIPTTKPEIVPFLKRLV